MINDLINNSYILAKKSHESINQKRKYTGEDYIVHPKNVAYLVELFGGTEEMIAASFLHDTLEDVFKDNDKEFKKEIVSLGGDSLLNLVIELTDKSSLKYGNREIRKKIDRDRYIHASNEAKLIKIADLIDNSLTICKYDINFSKIYIKEKRMLLEILNNNYTNKIYKLANDILIKNENKLMEIK
ncbi:MAG TPA: HD domain-containing protein [Buchnera sp. (in: enterobacteria)]|nr:HD domain-containing protein [Buchnera sp. (in: enterobacteria)]